MEFYSLNKLNDRKTGSGRHICLQICHVASLEKAPGLFFARRQVSAYFANHERSHDWDQANSPHENWLKYIATMACKSLKLMFQIYYSLHPPRQFFAVNFLLNHDLSTFSLKKKRFSSTALSKISEFNDLNKAIKKKKPQKSD